MTKAAGAGMKMRNHVGQEEEEEAVGGSRGEPETEGVGGHE